MKRTVLPHPPGSSREALAIALPMIISQSADTLMLFTDRWFLDKVSEHHLSATLAGGLMSFTLGIFFFGIITQSNALVGHYHGAKRYDRCSLATTQALILCALAYPLVLAIGIPLGTWLFRIAGHNPVQLELEIDYFRILTFGIILQFLRVAFSCFFAGIGRTTLVMIAQVTSVAINIPLSWAMVFGKLGLPAMELRGAAYATLIASAVGLTILVAGYLAPFIREKYAVADSLHFKAPDFSRLLRYGTPAGLEQVLNLGAFNVFVLMMHGYGDAVAAAVTILLSWSLVAFLPITGLQIAAISLVGQHLGSGNVKNAIRSTLATLRLAMIFTLVVLVVFLGFTDALIQVFGHAARDPEVASLARVLIRMSCIYLIFDAAHVVYAGALKGAGDTVWCLLTAASINCFLVLGTWLLRRTPEAGPVQIWAFYIVTIIVMGSLFAWRFHRGKWQTIQMIDN